MNIYCVKVLETVEKRSFVEAEDAATAQLLGAEMDAMSSVTTRLWRANVPFSPLMKTATRTLNATILATDSTIATTVRTTVRCAVRAQRKQILSRIAANVPTASSVVRRVMRVPSTNKTEKTRNETGGFVGCLLSYQAMPLSLQMTAALVMGHPPNPRLHRKV